jgi:hypothetical protein
VELTVITPRALVRKITAKEKDVVVNTKRRDKPSVF